MGVIAGTLTGTVALSTPLLLAALGETVVERAGVVNVGLEGIMLGGAFAATMAARPIAMGPFGIVSSPYFGVLAAALTGIAVALLFAAFAVKLAANQVVVGVVVNLLMIGLTGTLYRAAFGATGSFIEIPTLPAIVFGQNALTLFALLAVFAVAYWLYRTRAGLGLRACGEQPVAAEAAGVNVLFTRTLALAFGGIMAGLAGAWLSVGDVGTFKEEMTAGRGFIALAIVTSGRWRPAGCLIAALTFGFAQELQFQLQASGLRISAQLFLALPYVVTLLLLMRGGRWSQAPAALGQPYRRA